MLFTLCWIIGIISYLSIGSYVGNISNKTYLNESPTEHLGAKDKLIRFLLHPFSYGNWDERIRNQAMSIREFTRLYSNPVGPESLKRYTTVTTFVWPLKCFPIIGGLTLLAFKLMSSLGLLCAQIPQKLHRFLKDEKSNGLRTKLAELKEFEKTELAMRRAKLVDRVYVLEQQLRQIDTQLGKWADIVSRARDQKIATVRFEAVMQNLRNRRKPLAQNFEEMHGSLATLAAQERELRFILDTLSEYENTHLLLEGIEPGTGLNIEIAETLNLAHTIVDTCRRAYSIETQYLAHQENIEPEIIADQIEQSRVQEQKALQASMTQ